MVGILAHFGFRVLSFDFVLLAADAPVAPKQETNLRLLYSGLLLVGVLLIGALVIAWLQKWQRGTMSGSDQKEGLGSFRQALERGELTEEEYRRILNRMSGGKLRSPARPESPPASTDRPPSDGRTPESPTAE
jgi:hypothetical protein